MPRQSMAPPRQSLAGIGAGANNVRQSLAPGRGPRPSMAPKDPRMSMIGDGRRSSVAPNRPGAPKDPRNVTDKAFKKEAVEKLLGYLSEHGYDRNITPQMLQAPSVKDFVTIISFLLKATVPNFEFANKFEDEVPAVLKLLGYPNNISRSALASVGAPHAWPPILAALSWLVDLLKYSEAVQMAESDPNNDWASDGDAGERMFFEYLAKGYALFLKGEDDLSPLEEQIAFTFESKNASLRSDIQSLSAANEELSNEHKGYTEGPTPLQYAKAQNADFKSDQAKFEKHIADLHEHRKKVTARLAGLQAECTERQTELAGLMQEITMHKETIAAQELTPTDVERMHSEKEHLEAELSGLAKQKDTLAKQLWEEELATSRAVDRLETKVQQANNCSLRLHLIPKSAKNAKGYNHEISLNKSKLTADPSALVGPLDSAGHLQPSLQRVKAATAAEVTQAQDALLESESALTRRDEQSQERAEQLASLKAQLAKLEREEKELRDEHAAELAERKAETERLEEMIRKAKSANGQEVTASSNELQSLQKEFDDFTSHAAAARERMYSQLVSSIDMLTLHKENIENQLAGLKKHCSAKMDQLQTAIEIS